MIREIYLRGDDDSNYENRLEIKKYNNMTILNDSYNSNINGFINALDVLALYDTPKYIITPGIVESGSESESMIKNIIYLEIFIFIIMEMM